MNLNPTELFAKLRTIVFKVGVGLGALVLVCDVWRLLIPGRWPPLTLEKNLPNIAGAINAWIEQTWPLNRIAVLEAVIGWLERIWLFVALPLAGILLVAVLYSLWNHVIVPLFHWISRLVILLWRAVFKPPKIQRHLVICIDGTWNFPEELKDGLIKSSNVYKFWDQLEGERRKVRELTVGADLEKYHKVGDCEQISLYYPGVGNPATYSTLGTVIGGAFGFGAKTLRREAYRDIIRYRRSKDDKITIVGFSRGAAIARWLAAYIEEQGVPLLTLSDTFVGKWVLKGLRKLMPKVRLIKKRPVDVNFLGVWDTVASFGLGKNVLGIPFQRIDLFKDFSVAPSVREVVHLVSLDEQRDAFLPTLVEPPKRKYGDDRPDTKIHELWFAGVHSNVGGGFMNDGLSQITLEYMTEKFRQHYDGDDDKCPIRLKQVDYGTLEENIKSPLRHSTGMIYDKVIRPLPDDAALHLSVVKRMARGDLRYCPQNVSELMERLKKKKEQVVADLKRLHAENPKRFKEGRLEEFERELASQCKMTVVPEPS